MIGLIEYGAGNTASVANALSSLGVDYKITNRESEITKCEKVIFPGVGEASSAVKKLHLLNLFTLFRVLKKPMLGICLGMQLFCDKSEEGNVSCLGILPSTAKKFDDTKVKVPHMGWNRIKNLQNSKLFDGISDNEYFYFAHSYYLPINEYVIATAQYELEFCAALEINNYCGVQFHPEKSGEAGTKLLKNFIELC